MIVPCGIRSDPGDPSETSHFPNALLHTTPKAQPPGEFNYNSSQRKTHGQKPAFTAVIKPVLPEAVLSVLKIVPAPVPKAASKPAPQRRTGAQAQACVKGRAQVFGRVEAAASARAGLGAEGQVEDCVGGRVEAATRAQDQGFVGGQLEDRAGGGAQGGHSPDFFL
ncbi:hypothetical protein PR002_g7916 [Phytophthora rubi]|uniref:Uncharacterized protein n=1 Tax=Phytophthora rubi TaxID=129364 RepID=A0A6A3MUP1_9STRA|nr:hypothetical protein PR002_g7916 [Phytophthora rubi]